MPDVACTWLQGIAPVYLEIAGPPPTTAVLGRGHGRVGHRRAILANPASLISDARACASCLTSAFIASRVLCRPSLVGGNANRQPLPTLHPYRPSLHLSPPRGLFITTIRIKHRASASASTIRLALSGQVEILLALSQSESCVVNTIIRTTKTKKQTKDAYLAFLPCSFFPLPISA